MSMSLAQIIIYNDKLFPYLLPRVYSSVSLFQTHYYIKRTNVGAKMVVSFVFPEKVLPI